EIQTLIESCKFDQSELDLDILQARTGHAQIVFALLLALARRVPTLGVARTAQARVLELDIAIATALETLATRAIGGFEQAVSATEGALEALERAVSESRDTAGEAAALAALALYRALVASVTRLFPAWLATASTS